MDIQNLFSIKGQTILVSGASRGIGKVLAEGVTDAGANVVGFSRSIPQSRLSFDYRPCDITDKKAVETLIRDVHTEFGRIDGYLHVAGISIPAGADMQDDNVFESTIGTNLTSAYYCCRAVARVMTPLKRGSIALVTSIGSIQGFPGNPGYVASKGGLRMMSKALALDLGKDNIRVNALVPGYIRTAMTGSSYEDVGKRQARSDRTMLGRWGEAKELVGAAIFLMSDASSYVTGSDIVADGGWTAKGL